MDLSNSGKTHGFRAELIERSTAMIGTVPMYDAIGYLEGPCRHHCSGISSRSFARMRRTESISSRFTRV